MRASIMGMPMIPTPLPDKSSILDKLVAQKTRELDKEYLIKETLLTLK